LVQLLDDFFSNLGTSPNFITKATNLHIFVHPELLVQHLKNEKKRIGKKACQNSTGYTQKKTTRQTASYVSPIRDTGMAILVRRYVSLKDDTMVV